MSPCTSKNLKVNCSEWKKNDSKWIKSEYKRKSHFMPHDGDATGGKWPIWNPI